MRIECPHAARCPGCPLIGLAPSAQLAAKAARVARAFGPYAVLAEPAPGPVRPAPTLVDYRIRAKLVVAPGPRVGLYARGGHEVLDLPGCRVLAPTVAAGAAALRRVLADPSPTAGDVLRAEGDGSGRLRAVDLREVRDEAGASGLVMTLVVGAPPVPSQPLEPSAAALRAAAERLVAEIPALRGVAVSLHDGRSPQLLGAPPRAVLGPLRHRDVQRPGAPWVLAAAGSFGQAHRGQAASIQEAVVAALAPLAGRRVLELYAGSGALGLALAAAGARVTLVEAFAPAADAAAAAAREQGLAGVEVRAESSEAALAALRAAGARFEAALVNPPRRGLPPRVREALTAVCEGRLLYVSCAPETLARDLAHAAWLGWRAERIAPYDLIPLTAEVECVAVLVRSAPPLPAVLFEDDDWLVVDKPPHVPTHPHPEHSGSLLDAVRQLRGAGRAVPVHRLDAGTSGACLFAKSPEAVPGAQRALAGADAVKRYLALVRGVARPRGRIVRPLGGDGRLRPAETRYRRLAVVAGHALLEVVPGSGRTHQIRRHLAAVGEPVLGDERHGHAASNRHLFERAGLDRPFLHCASLALRVPRGGRRLCIEAPLAPDLRGVLERLGGDPDALAAPAPGAATRAIARPSGRAGP